MVPAPAEETFSGDAFQFKYEAVKAGDRLEMKIDGQINPARMGGSRGMVSLLDGEIRSEEHTSELQSLMRNSYAVFCLKKKNKDLYSNISDELTQRSSSYNK